ncbi:oxidoreductase [Nocardia acidivorans]|uniref:oxidoreductase n=1 Tax=Nocardia acidivorans TaxID=404580 RepID=UPI0009FC27E7|nr:oxidoreductase [Nocardia acidivorans]
MTITQQHRIGSGFGARSTADDVLAGIDLTGKRILITGGYSGLGLEATTALVRAGAHVIVPARRPEAARAALSGVIRTEVSELDLADQDSIRTFSERLLDSGRTLDVIINNAGVMAYPHRLIGPGWEAHFAINHLGHFALVNRLRPALARTGARVVSVASSGHFLSDIRWDDPHFHRDYDHWLAYGQSKTANALFATHLDALGGDGGPRAFSVHPGSILTPLQRNIPRAEQIAQGWITPDGRRADGFKSPAQGAATAVWAATSPLLAERGGAYCQDCDIAEPATTDDMLIGGVKPWAVDPDAAARLWALSSELTDVGGYASDEARSNAVRAAANSGACSERPGS